MKRKTKTVSTEALRKIAERAAERAIVSFLARYPKLEQVWLTDKPMLDQEVFKKRILLMGESAFYHPDFLVNYELARAWRNDEKLQEGAQIFYCYETLFLPQQTLDERRDRYDRLMRFGFPIVENLRTISARDAAKLADFIVAPYLFEQGKNQKFSAKETGRADWGIVSTLGLTEAHYSAAVTAAIEAIYY